MLSGQQAATNTTSDVAKCRCAAKGNMFCNAAVAAVVWSLLLTTQSLGAAAKRDVRGITTGITMKQAVNIARQEGATCSAPYSDINLGAKCTFGDRATIAVYGTDKVWRIIYWPKIASADEESLSHYVIKLYKLKLQSEGTPQCPNQLAMPSGECVTVTDGAVDIEDLSSIAA
jgi:hypothetical protein